MCRGLAVPRISRILIRGNVTLSPALRRSLVSKVIGTPGFASLQRQLLLAMMPRPRTPYNLMPTPENMLSIRKHPMRLGVCGLILSILMSVSGCVYRIDIQQGNFLEDKDIDRVTVGMTRVQVRSLLGTPMVADPFQNSRWGYVYYLKSGRLKKPVQRNFIVFFEDDKVSRIDRSTADAKAKA
jgi:outer membrane protein assembly factor BamE